MPEVSKRSGGALARKTDATFDGALDWLAERSIRGDDAGLTLVHGVVCGSLQFADVEMVRAWIEGGPEPRVKCMFLEHGFKTVVSRESFYSVGRVGRTARYSAEEALALWRATGNAGPWAPQLIAVLENGSPEVGQESKVNPCP